MNESFGAVWLEQTRERVDLNRTIHCTYNVTLVSVSVTIVIVEQQKVLHILSACL